MSRKPVLVQLSEDLIARLDELTEALGRSRSAVVRDAIEHYVAHESDAEKDRRTIEGYTRIPDDGEFLPWAEEGARRMIEGEPW
jgi:predicted transcriptional regulator